MAAISTRGLTPSVGAIVEGVDRNRLERDETLADWTLDALERRVTAAMTAMARWSHRAALDRDESRGLHQRVDAVEMKPELTHRLIVGGLDCLWTRPDRQPALATSSAGALT